MFVLLFRKTFPDLHPLGLFLLPATWFYFNLYLVSAYLWGILASSSLCTLALISTVYLIDRSSAIDGPFFASILTVLVGMFSWVAGLFIWPAGLVQLILTPSLERAKKSIIWVVAGGISLFINYILLEFPSQEVHGYSGYSRYLVVLFRYPFHKAVCFFEAIGSNISHEVISALLFGLLLLVLLFGVIIIGKRKLLAVDGIPWLILILYSALVILALVITRSGDGFFFGPANNLFFLPAVRHFPSIFLFVIGLYGLILCLALARNGNEIIMKSDGQKNCLCSLFTSRAFLFILLGLIVALLFSGYILHITPGIAQGILWEEENHENWATLRNYRNVDDETLNALNTDRVTLEKMEKYHISVFGGRTPGLYYQLFPKPIRERLLMYAHRL
jgi:hypothetical protein